MLYSRHLHDSGPSTQAVRAWFRASRGARNGPCAPRFQVFSLVVEVKLVQQTLSLVELSREELWELWSYGDRRGAAADRLLPPGPIPGHGLHAFPQIPRLLSICLNSLRLPAICSQTVQYLGRPWSTLRSHACVTLRAVRALLAGW